MSALITNTNEFNMNFEHLYPLKIGSITMKNRVIMGAMGNSVANDDRKLAKELEPIMQKAKGGVGLINEAQRVTWSLMDTCRPGRLLWQVIVLFLH